MDYHSYPKLQAVILSAFLKIHRALTFDFLYPHTIINDPKAIAPNETFWALISESKKNCTTKSGLQIIISLTSVTADTTKNSTPHSC